MLVISRWIARPSKISSAERVPYGSPSDERGTGLDWRRMRQDGWGEGESWMGNRFGEWGDIGWASNRLSDQAAYAKAIPPITSS